MSVLKTTSIIHIVTFLKWSFFWLENDSFIRLKKYLSKFIHLFLFHPLNKQKAKLFLPYFPSLKTRNKIYGYFEAKDQQSCIKDKIAQNKKIVC